MSTPEPTSADEASVQAASDASDAAKSPRRPRRRVRRSVRVPPDPRGPIAVLIAVAVLVGIIAITSALPRQSTAALPPPIVEPVATTTLVCPEPGGTDDAVITSALTSVPGLLGQDVPGTVTLGYLDRPDETVTADPQTGVRQPGDSAQVVDSDGRQRPLVVRADEGLAPGLVAGSYDLALGGPKRGLAMLNCPAPAPTWWFAGGGSTAGRSSTLYLVNPETTDAEVDIDIAGPEGLVSTPSLRGVIVPALSRQSVRLTAVAPQLPAAVWNVQVRTGRIVASLIDIDAEGFIQQGIDWVPPAADPATKVWLPGVLGTVGNRQLIIYTPGDTDAEIGLRILTADGAFTPVELDTIQAPAGVVTTVNLASVLNGVSATVELTSQVPIVAGMRQQHPGIDASGTQARIEVSYAAGATRLSSLASAAGLPAVRGTESVVWLTAPRPANTDDTGTLVEVRILPFPAQAQTPDPLNVFVAFDRSIPVNLPRPEGATWMTVAVNPTDHPVYAAQTSLRRGSRGSLISGYPLTALRTTVTIPTATQSVSLSLP